MNRFPVDAKAFYELRDDRTNRIVSDRGYQSARCLVTIDKKFADTLPGQVLLCVSCNLLSRWCRNVTIVLTNTKTHEFLSSSFRDLGNHILTQMNSADPFGKFEVQSDITGEPDIHLHIGVQLVRKSDNFVAVNASGWHAAISRSAPIQLSDSTETNVIGAIGAACLGVAQLFKYTINYPQDQFSANGILDLFRLEHHKSAETLEFVDPNFDFNLGRILMVGAGSVGSAAAYCFSLLNLKCYLGIVDHDVAKIENFNRSPIFDKGNYGTNKAEAVCEYLYGSTVKATPFVGEWNDFNLRHNREDEGFDIWLPLANENGVRWSMQSSIPPLMIHASTGRNWNVNHGRHIPGSDDCLVDRFQAKNDESVFACSTGKVNHQEVEIDAALPFLSVFAGLLITADLVRLSVHNYPQIENFAELFLGGDLREIRKLNKRARPECICTQQSELQSSINAKTKYSKCPN